MRYISVFSGIEAATVAWEQLGWEPVAFCEIDAFPIAVLAHRFPNVPNLGDITEVDWRKYRGEIDIIVGGSPCQSFSIAGKREGLKGESGLMFEYIRAVQEIMPRCFIWENVPGALSCEKGAAFGQLLSEMDALGYGLAWRVLDAQFFNVAQRRERVFLVGCIGDAQRAAEILFEQESLRWDSPSSREKRKELAADAQRGVGCSGEECMTPWDVQSKRIYSEHGCGPCLQSGTSEGMNIQPCVAYTLKIRGGCEGGGKGALVQEDMSATSNDQTLFQPIGYLCFNDQGGSVMSVSEEIAPTLRAQTHGHEPIVIDRAAFNQGLNAKYNPHIEETQVMDTLVATGHHALGAGTPMQVRRLTPRECERLQGFPDDWTMIPWKGKEAEACPDSPRYKALGNSMAVPVMRWIGERIDAVYSGSKVVQNDD